MQPACDILLCNTDHYRDVTVGIFLHTREVRGHLESIPGQTIWLPGGMDEAAACLAICFDLPLLHHSFTTAKTDSTFTHTGSYSSWRLPLCFLKFPKDCCSTETDKVGVAGANKITIINLFLQHFYYALSYKVLKNWHQSVAHSNIQ